MSYVSASVLAMILTFIGAMVMVQGTLWQQYPAQSSVAQDVPAYHYLVPHKSPTHLDQLQGLPPVVITAWVAENQ
jgi:hypothetical protein